VKRNLGAALKFELQFPDFALLNPGYGSDPIVMKPVTTTGFI
jgi:hypothetical protein